MLRAIENTIGAINFTIINKLLKYAFETIKRIIFGLKASRFWLVIYLRTRINA